MRVIGIAVSAVLLLTLPVRANLLTEPDFENAPTAQDTNFTGTGWTIPLGFNAGHTTWAAYMSGQGVYFPGWTNSLSPGGLFQDVAATPGTYTFSIWTKAEHNADPLTLELKLEFFDALTNGVMAAVITNFAGITRDDQFHQMFVTATCTNANLAFVRAGFYGTWDSTNGSQASYQFDHADFYAGAFTPRIDNGSFETPAVGNDFANTYWVDNPTFFGCSKQTWVPHFGGQSAVLEGFKSDAATYTQTLSQRLRPSGIGPYQLSLWLKRESTNMLLTNIELRLQWFDDTFTNQVQSMTVTNLGVIPGDNTYHWYHLDTTLTSPACAEAQATIFAQWDYSACDTCGNRATFIDDVRFVRNHDGIYYDANSAGYRPSVELVPGTNVAFLRVDYTTKTNTLYVLSDPDTVPRYSEETATMGLRYYWNSGFTNADVVTNMTLAGKVTVDSGAPFHGFPASGVKTLDLWRATWPVPQTNGTLLTNSFGVFYSPFLVISNGTIETDRQYLNPSIGAISNNLNQVLDPNFYGVDYSFTHTAPQWYAALTNGGFENPTADNTWTNSGWSGFGGTGREFYGPYSGDRGGVFYTWADDFGGCFQDVATTGGVYTFTFMFEKELPVIMTTCEFKMEWFSSIGEMIGASTQSIQSANDARWHRQYLTATNLHPNIAFVRTVIFADWNNATPGYPFNDATRYDDAELYRGSFTNQNALVNGDFNLSPGSFTRSRWDGVTDDALNDDNPIVGLDNWADHLAPGGTNYGADFRGFITNTTTTSGNISQGLVGQAPGTYVFSVYLKREPLSLLSNAELRIEWYDRTCSNKVIADTVSNITLSLPADDVWHYFALTGTCNSASLYEMRPAVYMTWGLNAAGGARTIMMDDAAFGPGVLDDSDGDGMSDAWELLHFGTLTNNPSGDNDSDGSPNNEEYYADTDPLAAGSYFKFITNATVVAASPNQIQFRFNPTSVDRIYDVYWKTNLLNNDNWQPVGLAKPGSGGILFLIVTNSPTAGKYYRTGIHLP